MKQFLKNIIGTKNEREVRRLQKRVELINRLESELEALTDVQLKEMTVTYRQRIEAGESLEAILPEAYATVREVSKRHLSMRHFDVQMIGGIALHEGNIAEMRTGEGKTLVATLAAYLNALTGRGVHIVTVNDYLSKRDAHWMGPIYDALGISLGVIQSSGGGDDTSFRYRTESVGVLDKFTHLQPCTRREAYVADVVYGTNNEFGFDYLRTNMVMRKEDRLQRELYFAIVDEVDSILIDEARTPLVISGAAAKSTELYRSIDELIKPLVMQPQEHTRLLTELSKQEIKGSNSPGYFTSFKLQGLPAATAKQLEELKARKDLGRAQKRQNYDELLELLEQQLAGDFIVDEKSRSVDLTESGFDKMEQALTDNDFLSPSENLYAAHNINLMQHINNALRAYHLFKRNVEYICHNGEIILIDEHTGRKMPGRRLSEGLHQSIEAKEKLPIQHETQTVASTTFQNYFRLYEKLSGMTGTADTEAMEFHEIYNLNVLVIPTNMAVARTDYNDLIYLTEAAKFKAVLADIKAAQERGAPILVGTISIEISEMVSRMLEKEAVKHNVLNAKFHEQEAEIIATAGEPGQVTIATNMAGRGTDIVLGGNLDMVLDKAISPDGEVDEEVAEKIKEEWQRRHQQVIEAGGLHIIGTERHESRRIDNQLRGRSGRQGDPGTSRFYLSMEDDLMRLFASDRVRNMMQALGMEGDEAIEHRMVSNSIEKAQRKVETRNFDIRKSLLEFDNVANDQRMVIYQQRNELLDDLDMTGVIEIIRGDVIEALVTEFLPLDAMAEQWDLEGLETRLIKKYLINLPISQWLDEDTTRDQEQLKDYIIDDLQQIYEEIVAQFPEEISIHQFERDIMLQILDNFWRDHLATMDSLRSGINLRSYAQKNPKQEYKRESFLLFQRLLEDIKQETISYLSNLKLLTTEDIEQAKSSQREEEEMMRQSRREHHPESQILGHSEANQATVKTYIRKQPKVGRNAPCPCGSGKKFKQCCGKI